MENTEESSTIEKLRALSEISKFKHIFSYLARRTLPSKATDIYSVDPDGFSHATFKEFLSELEKLGIGRFLNSRSFSWEGFDPRKVGRIGVKMAKLPNGAKRKEVMDVKELYRQDFSDESNEKALIKEVLRKQSRQSGDIDQINQLLSANDQQLVGELERRGWDVHLKLKTKDKN